MSNLRDIPSAPDWGSSNQNSSSGNLNTNMRKSMDTIQTTKSSDSLSPCARCSKIIQGQGLQAIGKRWHPECFVCDFCNRAFDNGAFIHKYERAYCKPCDLKLFSSYCKVCNSPIEGNAVNALNSTFHPEHFQCSKCKTSLTSGVFHEKNGRPFCANCISTLPPQN